MTAYIVDSTALRENARRLQAAMSGAVCWAVVKGDGYGLGIEALVSLLLEEQFTHFAVTEPAEAEVIRALSATAEILMLRPCCEIPVLERLLAAGAICTVSSPDDATVLSAVAGSMQCTARVHCKVDTGMGRYGFQPEELPRLTQVFHMPQLRVEGVYTHFHSAFCSEKATRRQFALFQEVLSGLRAAGVDPGMCHCCNSSAALRWPEMRMDAVRLGSALLGRLNHPDGLGLQKIGWCEATVDEPHTLHRGESTGYGAGWRARRDTQLVILPVGYFHGFAAEKGRDLFRLRDCLRGACSLLLAALRRKQLTVRIDGKVYPVRGHVGMLHTAVDVTGANILPGAVARLEVNPLLQKDMPIVFR